MCLVDDLQYLFLEFQLVTSCGGSLMKGKKVLVYGVKIMCVLVNFDHVATGSTVAQTGQSDPH